ncbi:MAG: 4-hydroxy-tetrahydrodipicolinate synthase, partial [Patescibacteria group bacterium]|nr:4-hydroxy-tetrahydrodipicolinate synthase [Patescibacteria group bacterium]
MAKKKYAGTWTALITPFKKDGSLDEEALRALIREQIKGGVTGVVSSGTTGESPTMTPAEDTRAAEIAVEEAKGHIMVMAGTGSNCTWEAVKYTRNAKNAGADCCLVVSPYYNKPTPEGLRRHYTAIADVGLPVIVYNIKGRTGINIDTDTLMKIAQHPMIVGVKEASGDIEQMKDVIARRPDDLTVLSGDDGMTLALMQAGGDGVISVASNIVPGEVSELVRHAQNGERKEAEDMNSKFSDMFKKLFIESNPVPVKYCAHRMGLCELEYRLPMCEPTEK